MSSGEAIPDDILQAPILNEGLLFYLQAFNELDTERNHSMGISRIPWSSMIKYAEYHGLDYEESLELVFIIRRVDNQFCEWLDQQNEQSKRLKQKGSTD